MILVASKLIKCIQLFIGDWWNKSARKILIAPQQVQVGTPEQRGRKRSASAAGFKEVEDNTLSLEILEEVCMAMIYG